MGSEAVALAALVALSLIACVCDASFLRLLCPPAAALVLDLGLRGGGGRCGLSLVALVRACFLPHSSLLMGSATMAVATMAVAVRLALAPISPAHRRWRLLR